MIENDVVDAVGNSFFCVRNIQLNVTDRKYISKQRTYQGRTQRAGKPDKFGDAFSVKLVFGRLERP